MNTYYNIFILFFFITSYSFSKVEVIEPRPNQNFCNDKEVNFILNQNSSNFEIIAYLQDTQSYINISNINKIDNIISWYPSDSIMYNQAIDFKIYNKYDSDDFVVISNIIIKKKIEILNQTRSVLICEGEELNLSVETNDNNNKYQWRIDGKIIPNANSPIFYIDSSLHTNSGTYTCVVSNDSQCEAVESDPIIVYIATETKFISRIKDFQYDQYEAARRKGMSAQLVAKVHINDHPDANNIKFEWWKDTLGIMELRPSNAGYKITPGLTKRVKLQDGSKYSGTNTDVLNIRKIQWSDRTNYYCIATGLCGSATSECYIGKNTLFTIQNSTNEFEGCENQDAILEVYVELNENVQGKLSYRWYKSGTGFLTESEKYIGTDKPRLILRKLNEKEDTGLYLCLVSLAPDNVAQFSGEFLLNISYKPRIRQQPTSIAILDQDRKYFTQTYIDVAMDNPVGCLYTWFRDGKIARKECWVSDYFLGIDSCPGIFPAPPRDPHPDDVGWYRCRIRNQCGITWSDSVYISWGFDPTRVCENSDATLKAPALGQEYTYEWIRDGKILSDNEKYANTNTNELTVRDTKKPDNGKYICNAIKIKDGSKVEFGIISLRVDIKPYVIRDFPYQIKNIGPIMPNTYFVVQYRSPKYYYRLYIDGKPETDLVEVDASFDDDKDRSASLALIIGGKNNRNVKPGVYQYYFKADCGELWSSKMIVINTEYVETGSIPENDSEEENLGTVSNLDLKDYIQNLNTETGCIIYPNPSYNTLNIINLNSTSISSESIQIYNSIGIEVKNFQVSNYNQNKLEIDISNLNSGMYFIRIGNKLDKFIKLE